MDTYISRSPEETRALGESWGKSAKAGLVIGLSGDLGAGKTELVKGLARGLGTAGQVHSPSFALVHEYGGGRLPLFHLDLYRLETPSQIRGAGLEEYFNAPAGVTVVEWAERWSDFSRHGQAVVEEDRRSLRVYRRVAIETVSETERHIVYEDFGA